VMVYAPDPQLRSRLSAAMSGARLLIHISRDAAATEPHQLLPQVRRQSLRLWPGPAAPKEARSFVSETLLDWKLPRLVAQVGEVAAEVTAGATTDTTTGLELMLSRVDDRVRIAVRDHQPQPCAPSAGELPRSPLTGSGLRLVQALARGWGVIPARNAGKTIWVVLDTATGQRLRRHTHHQQVSAAHESGRR
jgi:hypothetical protein